jgi:putative acetyltransferase
MARDPGVHPVRRDEGPRLLEVWEGSVRATHRFLTEADIAALRPQVLDGVFALDHLLGVHGPDGRLIAFLGVHGDALAALFVDAAWLRRGIGRRLAGHAIHALGATTVEVNEQNPDAVAFYRSQGFDVIGRSPLDGTGKPFPLLHMRRLPRQVSAG